MATSTWSTALLHDTDANFRIWGKKISDEFQAMSGLVKTGDTGQVDWTSVLTVRPGTSADGGYEIYYLNDSLHSTSPIYIRFDFGTSTSTTRPRLRWTIGSGSDGAGVITGTALSAVEICTGQAGPTAGVKDSYLCVAEGFFGFVGWAGGAVSGLAHFGFMLTRTCDTSGTADELGALALDSGGITATTNLGENQSFRWTSVATAYVRSTSEPVFVVGAETTTIVSGLSQVYLAWCLTPYQQPVRNICGALLSEIGEFSIFSVALIGATSHTYINVSRQMGIHINSLTPTNWGICMLWE